MATPKPTLRQNSQGSTGRRALPLAARFQFALVVAAVLPLVLVSTLGLVNSLAVQRAQIADLQQEASKNAANVIDGYLAQLEDEMTLAVRGRFFQGDETANALLDTLLAYNVGFETLSLMDETGQEMAKRSRYLLFSAQDLTDQADSAEFIAASAGERYLGPISISQYAEPLVTLAIPIKNVRSDVEGVLSAEINLKYMWDIIARLESGLGSYAYVVDSDGRLIAHRDSSLVLQGRNLSELEGVQNALQTQAIAGSYTGLEGEPVLGAYQGLRRANWFVMLEAPTRQALANVYRTLLINVGAILGTAALAILLGWRLARLVIQPVRSLQAGAEIIGRGDLAHRIEIQSSDEIGSLAGAFNTMADELQQTIGTLEQRVADRTRDLEHRAVQLATAADVGRAAASILELETLTRQVVELIRERFDLYYAGLFLLDDAGQYAVLEAGSGEAGRLMKDQGHRLRVGGVSMVGSACAQHQARIALDVGEEAVRFDNPLLPDTRSETALPLMVGERVLGALDVQSTQPSAFSEEDIAVLQLVADQTAVAVDNARKFSDEATLVEATNPLFRVSRRLSAATTTDDVVEAITTSVAETEADGCAIARFGFAGDAEDRPATLTFVGSWARQAKAPFPIGVTLPVGESHLPWDLMGAFWMSENLAEDARLPDAARDLFLRQGNHSVVNVPIRSGERVTGFVIVYRTTASPFSPVSIRLFEALADQAAVALERANLLDEAQRRAAREQLTREITDKIRRAPTVASIVQTSMAELARALGTPHAFTKLGVTESPTNDGQDG